jgi:CRP-like cAMP-binding protein
MYLHPLLTGVPARERAALAEASTARFYKRNDRILLAGESTDQVFCVGSGLLRAVAPGRVTGADVTTEFSRQNDFLYAAPISADRYVSAQTVVAALSSTVYSVPIAIMRDLCTTHPDVAAGLLALAIRHMSLLRVHLQSVQGLSPQDLVCRILHQMTQLAPAGPSCYDKHITQAVIASYSGLSREVVNKTMRDFESRGLVRREADGIHVADYVVRH